MGASRLLLYNADIGLKSLETGVAHTQHRSQPVCYFTLQCELPELEQVWKLS